jgi:hypothetical protein
MERVPTLRLSHLNDAERRAYILADNKLAQNANWDREMLALELKEAATATVGLNIPLPWGKEASEQQAATAQLGAAQQRYDAALLDIQSALGEALARLKEARQADALVARKALPEARAALKSIIADYTPKGAATLPPHSTRSTRSTASSSSCSNYSWTSRRCSLRSNG